MKYRMIVVIAVLMSFLTAGCSKSEKDISKDLEKKGTRELLEEAAKDEYDPPADGKLTDSQIQMYMKVREHEKAIAKVARQELEDHAKKVKEKGGDKSLGGMMEAFKGIGSVADLVTADIRAAQDLGYNTAEYTWVKGQILAASAAAAQEKMFQITSAGAQKGYDQLKQAYENATDEQSKQALKGMMDQAETSMAEMKQEKDPAVEYNRKLLSKYENELNAIAQEWSKYEDREGEMKEGLDKLETQAAEAQAGSENQQ